MDKDFININGIDFNILSDSLFEIENFYRPLYFRLIEYIYLISCFLISRVTKLKVPNLTIGKYQIGILNYLKYLGNDVENIHLDYVLDISFLDILRIFKLCMSSDNNEVVYFVVNNLLYGKKFNSVGSAVRYIGLGYNGSYNYAVMLNNIYRKIKNCA